MKLLRKTSKPTARVRRPGGLFELSDVQHALGLAVWNSPFANGRHFNRHLIAFGDHESRAISLHKMDGIAVLPQGYGGGFKNSNQFQTLIPAGHRSLIVPDAVQEVLALGFERFLLLMYGAYMSP